MNLIEIAEDLKDVPDQYLMQEVQQPTGNFPAYLVISELSRRKRMRDKVTKEMPSQTVAEELAMPPQPQMPPQMAPQGLMGMPQAQTELAAQDAMGTTPPEMMMPTQMMAGGGIVSFKQGGDVIRAANGLPEGMFQGDAVQSNQPTMKGLIPAFTENVGKGYEFYEDYFRGGIYKDLEQLKRLGYTDAQISQMSPEIRAYVSKSTRAPVFGASDAPVTPVVPAAVRPTVTPAPGGAPPAPPPSRDIRSAFATPSPVTIPERQSDYAIQTARAQRMSDYEQAVPDRLTPFLQEAITKREGDIESRRASNINDALIQAGLGAMRAKPKFRGSAGLFEVLGAGGQEGFNVLREGRKDIRQSEEAILSARAKMMEAQSLRDQNKFKLADEVDKQARDEYKLGIDLANTQSAMNLRTLQGNIALAGAPADVELKRAQTAQALAAAAAAGRLKAPDQTTTTIARGQVLSSLGITSDEYKNNPAKRSQVEQALATFLQSQGFSYSPIVAQPLDRGNLPGNIP